MNLDEKIQYLQSLKAKTLKYAELKTIVQETYLGTDPELVSEVIEFLDSRINNIINSDVNSHTVTSAPAAQITTKNFKDVPSDPLTMALKYNKFQGKTFTIKTKHGDVKAKLRGVSHPFVIMETETGHTIKIDPNEVQDLN